MIKNHLSRILGERRWSQRKLSQETGIRASTISEIYNEINRSYSEENLDRICETLDITIPELLEYIPNKQRKTGKDLILEEHGNRKN